MGHGGQAAELFDAVGLAGRGRRFTRMCIGCYTSPSFHNPPCSLAYRGMSVASGRLYERPARHKQVAPKRAYEHGISYLSGTLD